MRRKSSSEAMPLRLNNIVSITGSYYLHSVLGVNTSLQLDAPTFRHQGNAGLETLMEHGLMNAILKAKLLR